MDRSELKDKDIFIQISPDPLELATYTGWVGDPSAGAIATFSGTTRNTFDGKRVDHLEYEAYAPMALKSLHEICQEALRKWELIRIAVAHRTGVVPVGEPSVIIAASSAHRRDALEVSSRLLLFVCLFAICMTYPSGRYSTAFYEHGPNVKSIPPRHEMTHQPWCIMQACQWTIDELKAIVPIWKKEFFEGGEIWKENAESRARLYTRAS